MANEIRDALARITARIGALEREMEKLRTAADVLQGLEAQEQATAGVPTDVSKTECIRRILRERTRATTQEIIRAVRLAFPNAGTSGIRSILSLGKKRGDFRREGDHWMLVTKKNETAASLAH